MTSEMFTDSKQPNGHKAVRITLKDGRNGYDAVGEYVKRFWKRHRTVPVLIRMATSYDDTDYSECIEYASPYQGDDIMYDMDWWEGEKYIILYGIRSVYDIDISDGVYDN